MIKIPFNNPQLDFDIFNAILKTREFSDWSTNNYFRLQCEQWLANHTASLKVYLTPSCSDALEMAAILADIQAGDEVIMPSFTFPSTANAFALRGAIPVFVDIRMDTLNIDETLIEQAITPKTRAIVPVHYAGVACEMDTIMDIAKRHKLIVIEDAAQGINAFYKNRALGSIGHLGTYSFHSTKNIHCGEGGALLINDSKFLTIADAVRDKGTDRQKFLNGEVKDYTWVSLGSSFALNTISSTLLWSQLSQIKQITNDRRNAWNSYHQRLHSANLKTYIQFPTPTEHILHNAHIYYILLKNAKNRDALLQFLQQVNIQTAPHYQPLHNSCAGKHYGRSSGQLQNTITCSEQILRLPLWPNIPVNIVCDAIESFFKQSSIND